MAESSLLEESEPVVPFATEVGGLDQGYLLSSIVPWEGNPRKRFDEADLQELAESIKRVGRVLQPISVRFLAGANPASEKRFSIVCGERRWRAAQLAGLTRIRAEYLGEMSDSQALECAYRENHDRADLSPIEEARTFERMLAEETSLTQQGLGERLTIGQGTVSNALRLLRLPESIIDRVDRKQISKSAATALCGVLEHTAMFENLVLGIGHGWSSGRIEDEVRLFKAQIAEQKRQTEVAAKPQLPFEEDTSAVPPVVADTSVASAESTVPTTSEDEDLVESDLIGDDYESIVTEDTEGADGDESDEEDATEDASTTSDDVEDRAEVPSTSAPANYPLPSAATGLTAKNVTPSASSTVAAAPIATNVVAATPAPAVPTSTPSATANAPTVPVAAPATAPAIGVPAPTVSALPEPASGYKWVQMRTEDDDALFMDLDLNDLDQAMTVLRTYFPTAMSRKLLKAISDSERASLPHAEPMTLPQLLQHILTNTARMRGIDTDTIQELPE